MQIESESFVEIEPNRFSDINYEQKIWKTMNYKKKIIIQKNESHKIWKKNEEIRKNIFSNQDKGSYGLGNENVKIENFLTNKSEKTNKNKNAIEPKKDQYRNFGQYKTENDTIIKNYEKSNVKMEEYIKNRSKNLNNKKNKNKYEEKIKLELKDKNKMDEKPKHKKNKTKDLIYNDNKEYYESTNNRNKKNKFNNYIFKRTTIIKYLFIYTLLFQLGKSLSQSNFKRNSILLQSNEITLKVTGIGTKQILGTDLNSSYPCPFLTLNDYSFTT